MEPVHRKVGLGTPFASFSTPRQEGLEVPVGENEGDFMVFPRLEGLPGKLFISRFCLSV